MTESPTAPPLPAPAPAPERRGTLARLARVSAVLAASAGILTALLVITGPLAVIRGRTVRVDFTFAGPIKPGASVRMAGIVVGTVRDVELLAGQDREAGPDKMVRVVATIEDRAMPVVTERAHFRVTTLGVLGEHYLDIEPASAPGGTMLADGARVDGESQARPDLLLARASALLERAEALLPESPEAKDLMTSLAALSRRLDKLLEGGAVDGVSRDLQALLKGAAAGVGDGQALRRTLERLPPTLDRTEALEARLARELEVLDEGELAATLGDVRGTLAKLDKTLDALSAAPLMDTAKQEQLRVDMTAAARAIDKSLTRADRLLGAVEAKKGAAGKLFWDEEVAGDLKAVLAGLRKDPVRFFLSPER